MGFYKNSDKKLNSRLNKNHIHPNILWCFIFHWNLHVLYDLKIPPPYPIKNKFSGPCSLVNGHLTTSTSSPICHRTRPKGNDHSQDSMPQLPYIISSYFITLIFSKSPPYLFCQRKACFSCFEQNKACLWIFMSVVWTSPLLTEGWSHEAIWTQLISANIFLWKSFRIWYFILFYFTLTFCRC